eukprot:8180473-Alexandrium_andersonii.AAC.1
MRPGAGRALRDDMERASQEPLEKPIDGEPGEPDLPAEQSTPLGRWQSKRLKPLGLQDDGSTHAEQALEAARAGRADTELDPRSKEVPPSAPGGSRGASASAGEG